MNRPTHSTQTGQYETVEQLIRYAASEFERVGVEFRPSKASKVIRRAFSLNPATVRRQIDAYIDREQHKATWRGFELFSATGYADPTAAHALANVEWAGRTAVTR
ncbi:hypothetical protein [Microcella alkalica]|uniref:hypothetical protein n=1 Tax=Microcella alkalica TaxID=355930 RepID=UPI00145D7E8A|nr:hypothetical protein [Microcella alkalica]